MATLPSQKMQVACQMVHWIQQALIERSMDGEVRVNKNKGAIADDAKGHDETSHGQEMVSGEVHKERGGNEEVHEARESDKRACRARAGCNGVCKVKESDNGPLEGRESGNGVLEARESCNRVLEVRESSDRVHKARESDNKVKESGNEACERRVMVNGDDIHVKMVSGDRKVGKDEAN